MSYQSVEEERTRRAIGEAQIGAGARLEAANIAAGSAESVAGIHADASKYASDNSLSGQRYVADQQLQGALAPKTVNYNQSVFLPDDDLQRAEGGPVLRRVPYLVGEKGPELMVPETNGVIIPNHVLRASVPREMGGYVEAGGATVPGRWISQAALKSMDENRKLRAAEQSNYLKRLDEEGDKIRTANEKTAQNNLNLFFTTLGSLYGVRDDKGKITLPDDIRRLAAGMMESATNDPHAAVKQLGEKIAVEKQTKAKWESIWPQVVKDREQATGKKMTPEEVKGLAALAHQNPDQAGQIIGHLENKAGQQPTPTGQQQVNKEPLVPEVPGESMRDYVGRATVRNDQLSADAALQRYNKAVDESGAPGWLAWGAKNLPGVRDAIDENSPLRRAGRAILDKIVGEPVPGPTTNPQANSQVPTPSMDQKQPSFPKELIGLFPQAAEMAVPKYSDLRGAGGRPIPQTTPPPNEQQDMLGPFGGQLRSLANQDSFAQTQTPESQANYIEGRLRSLAGSNNG
jgi:hypothetical protein